MVTMYLRQSFGRLVKPKALVPVLGGTALLTGSILAGGVGLFAAPNSAEASALLARAHAGPVAQQGQIVHVITRDFEQHAPNTVGGPPHIDANSLFPDTTISDIWVVVGDGGRIARAATYTRDGNNNPIRQTVVDESGRVVSNEVRQSNAQVGQLGQPGMMTDVGGQGASLEEARAAQAPTAMSDGWIGGQPTVTLEYTTQFSGAARADAEERLSETLGNTRLQSMGRRLTFDKVSESLLRYEQFAVDDRGRDRLVRATDWQLVEVLDAARVPSTTLAPTLPMPNTDPANVFFQSQSLADAARTSSFVLYAIKASAGEFALATVTVPVGQRTAAVQVPLQFRGLDFAVQRGDAIQITYQPASHRTLTLIEGPSTTFAASLRQAPAFWKSARSVTVLSDAQPRTGWSLASAPVPVTDPSKGSPQEVPGPRWVLLPDLNGTAVLAMSEGYTEAELLAAMAQLRAQS